MNTDLTFVSCHSMGQAHVCLHRGFEPAPEITTETTSSSMVYMTQVTHFTKVFGEIQLLDDHDSIVMLSPHNDLWTEILT